MTESPIAALARNRRFLRRFAVPAGLLLIAAVAAVDGFRLVRDATSASPSAPAGWYLCSVAGVLAATAAYATLRDGRATEDAGVSPTASKNRDGSAKAWRAIVLMILYAYAVPWVGFAITTAVFAIVYLRWVAGYPVVRCVAYGLTMDVVAVVLFDRAGVVLPTGAYGF